MNKRIPALFAVLAILVLIPLFAAQSRTTEYHVKGQKIAKDTTLNMTLPDGKFLTGTVKGPTGAVIKGASVFVGDATDSFSGMSGTTNAAGKFSIPVQAGTKYIIADPPASASVDPAKFSRLVERTIQGIKVTKDTSYGNVALQNGFILSGRVDLPAGPAPFMFMPTIEVFKTNMLTLVNIAQTGGTSQVIQDKYAVALPSGTYRLLTRATVLNQAFQAVALLPNLAKVTVNKDTSYNVKLAAGGYGFSGTVKDSSGTALDGFLYAVPKTGNFKGWPIAYATVIKGVFGVWTGMNVPNLFLPAGNYVIVFVPLSYMTGGSRTSGYSGKAAVTFFDLTMPAAAKTQALVAKNGVVMSGKVTNAQGKAAQAMIMAFSTGAPLNVDMLGLNFAFAQTDDNGNYRLALLVDTYNVSVVPLTTASAAPRPQDVIRRMMVRAVSNGSSPF